MATSRLRHTDVVTDDHGDQWRFTTVVENGLATLTVTAPGLEPRRLVRRNSATPRPQRDAEEPLPMENL